MYLGYYCYWFGVNGLGYRLRFVFPVGVCWMIRVDWLLALVIWWYGSVELRFFVLLDTGFTGLCCGLLCA